MANLRLYQKFICYPLSKTLLRMIRKKVLKIENQKLLSK
jgi:hypothetical protein